MVVLKFTVFVITCILIVNAAPPSADNSVDDNDLKRPVVEHARGAARPPARQPFRLHVRPTPQEAEHPAPAPASSRRGGRSRSNQRDIVRGRWTSLARSVECENDITSLCPKEARVNNFAIINCLQRDETTAEKVSTRCQHFIWEFKRNMTTSPVFSVASRHVCDEDFKNITECESLRGSGQRVACLFEYKQRVTRQECLMFMNRIGAILFSDYHFIYKFADRCAADIKRLHCGRLSARPAPAAPSSGEGDDDGPRNLPGSQGRTIECLLEDVDRLEQKCAHEIMRVAELQADDFHLDRPLFFACREDREKVCAKVTAGEGRVYKCLMNQLHNPLLSADCRKHVTMRMRLREKTYKVDYSFAGVCEADARKAKCLPESPGKHEGSLGVSIALSTIVLCLEDAVKTNSHPVTPECMSEMLDVRTQLMSDYKISPEIMSHCREALKAHCDKGLQRNGITLHCLMDQYKGSEGNPGLQEYPKCRDALKKMIKVADPASDYRVDPVIRRVCGPVISSSCSDAARTAPHTGAVFSCLMEQFNSPDMPSECAEKVLELQYILSRDFTLQPRLYQACRTDAISFCEAPKDWKSAEGRPREGLIFSCLLRNLQDTEAAREMKQDEDDDDDDDSEKKTKTTPSPGPKISATCSQEVLRVLRERSSRLMLVPYVYDACLTDLATHCVKLSPGKSEMRCLQKNYEQLKDKCKKVVEKFSAEQERHPSLDYIMASSCQPMIKRFCESEMKSDPGLIMPCLIRHKHNPEMDVKCRAGVEHHQIISLKGYHVSVAFRRSCARDLHRHCSKVKSKAAAVHCLSEVVRNNTLLDKRVPLTRSCLQQVRFENFQKSEDIALSPRLARACSEDLRKWCSDVEPSKKVKCLRKQRWSKLLPRCQRAMFRRVQLESMDSRIDARLQRVCRSMIRHYCFGHERDALDCLWGHIHDEEFDPKCRRVVYLRLETRARDYRLDPLITQLCRRDIRKHCQSVLDPRANMTGGDYRGKVTACLKEKFSNFELSSGCQGHMRQLILETNMNHHMDPILRRACEKDVQRVCSAELVDTDGNDGDGRITECLKKAVKANKLKSIECQKETLRLIEEAHADVHVDPVLYQACRHELGSICRDVPLGKGKQMACLLWAKDDKEARKGMSYTCRKQIQARADMWEMAAKLAPPENLQELASQISSSNARNYFFGFLAAVVLAIFVFGLCCGRVTKRVRVDAKNK